MRNILISLIVMLSANSLNAQDFSYKVKLNADVKINTISEDKKSKLNETLKKYKYDSDELIQCYPNAKNKDLLNYYFYKGIGDKKKFKKEIEEFGVFDIVEEGYIVEPLDCSNPYPPVNDSRIVKGSSNNWALEMIEAQYEWAPIGAEWYFSYELGDYGFIKISSVKDTIILNKKFKQLRKELVYINYYNNESIDTAHLGDEYTFLENDTVYCYRNKRISFLYDFSAKVGDVWIIPGDHNSCDSVGHVKVVNTYTENIGEDSFRAIVVEPIRDSHWHCLWGLGWINSRKTWLLKLYVS